VYTHVPCVPDIYLLMVLGHERGPELGPRINP
jgi:hypothetical protein